jgi:hypothetical protein
MTHHTGNLQDKIRFVTGSRRIRIRSSNGQIVLSGVARNALAGECAVAICEWPGTPAISAASRGTVPIGVLLSEAASDRDSQTARPGAARSRRRSDSGVRGNFDLGGCHIDGYDRCSGCPVGFPQPRPLSKWRPCQRKILL